MEQVLETMKVEGIEPDVQIQALLAKHYTKDGLNEKAETVLKEIEGENLKENRWLCATLIRLYAYLGKADEVERIWKVCESNPGVDDCLAAVEASGRLKKIDEAESIFERASKKWKLNSKNYSVLLMIYANNNMLKKGEELIKRMEDSGMYIGCMTCNALVKLYIHVKQSSLTYACHVNYKRGSSVPRQTQPNAVEPNLKVGTQLLQFSKNLDPIEKPKK
ncbi:pentatricopeptide repeat-containing protein At1g15480, mitochondrial-like [Vigna umbellata]|uniref:pentatricopeptide repeat-containing protein At1g15480, mitochondrial-like n=1 Tax=Vigna umbellata TaxID=87088 RepID=UPI001F5EA352|nr:pentatricopeptide repeat-containing protein At1g15480, mitochondrial-like [Vigna umbellata]